MERVHKWPISFDAAIVTGVRTVINGPLECLVENCLKTIAGIDGVATAADVAALTEEKKREIRKAADNYSSLLEQVSEVLRDPACSQYAAEYERVKDHTATNVRLLYHNVAAAVHKRLAVVDGAAASPRQTERIQLEGFVQYQRALGAIYDFSRRRLQALHVKARADAAVTAAAAAAAAATAASASAAGGAGDDQTDSRHRHQNRSLDSVWGTVKRRRDSAGGVGPGGGGNGSTFGKVNEHAPSGATHLAVTATTGRSSRTAGGHGKKNCAGENRRYNGAIVCSSNGNGDTAHGDCDDASGGAIKNGGHSEKERDNGVAQMSNGDSDNAWSTAREEGTSKRVRRGHRWDPVIDAEEAAAEQQRNQEQRDCHTSPPPPPPPPPPQSAAVATTTGGKRRRGGRGPKPPSLPPPARLLLDLWVMNNLGHPYPAADERCRLAAAAGVTEKQVAIDLMNSRSPRRGVLTKLRARAAARGAAVADAAAAAGGPAGAKRILDAWMLDHLEDPQPTECEMRRLTAATGVPIARVEEYMAVSRAPRGRAKTSANPARTTAVRTAPARAAAATAAGSTARCCRNGGSDGGYGRGSSSDDDSD